MFNIQITEEGKALKELQIMDTYSSDAFKQFKSFTNQAYNTFWFGETSPKVKVVLLGVEALDVFTKSAQAQGFIKLIEPDYVELEVPNGYVLVPAEDGSMTITGEYVDPDIAIFEELVDDDDVDNP